MDNKSRSAACVVFHNGKVLLGRHNYGAGKGLLIIPGGFLNAGEKPEHAAERETLEETGIRVKVGALVGIRFKEADWYVIFKGEYIETVTSEHDSENSEIVWLEINEALNREDVPDLTKEAIRSALKTEDRQLVPKYTRTREKDIYFTYYG